MPNYPFTGVGRPGPILHMISFSSPGITGIFSARIYAGGGVEMSKTSRVFLSVAILLLIYIGYLVYEWVILRQSGSTYNYVIPFFIFSNPFAALKVADLIAPIFFFDFMAWIFWAVSFIRDGR